MFFAICIHDPSTHEHWNRNTICKFSSSPAAYPNVSKRNIVTWVNNDASYPIMGIGIIMHVATNSNTSTLCRCLLHMPNQDQPIVSFSISHNWLSCQIRWCYLHHTWPLLWQYHHCSIVDCIDPQIIATHYSQTISNAKLWHARFGQLNYARFHYPSSGCCRKQKFKHKIRILSEISILLCRDFDSLSCNACIFESTSNRERQFGLVLIYLFNIR